MKTKNLPFKTLLTIHNLGYQGYYSALVVNKALGTNFKEGVNSLKLGIEFADIINTVSPTYAKEILTKEFGFGLDEVLKKRKKSLFGILNGLDEEVWNPETDRLIFQNYSAKNLEKKNENKRYLLKRFFGKADLNPPLLSIVSRLAPQKGIDLIMEIFPQLIKENLYFVLLGKGAQEYEKFFLEMERKYPFKFKANILFDEKLAHQIYAGADIFLMPSYFEPCGLGQQISMKYGTVPVAREVGGIRDTVKNVEIKRKGSKLIVKGDGFLFQDYKGKDFFEALKTALELYQKKEIWQKIQKNGMKKDFSWKKSAKKYLKLYQKLK